MFTILGLLTALSAAYLGLPFASFPIMVAPVTGMVLLALSVFQYSYSVRELRVAESEQTPGILETFRNCRKSRWIDYSLMGIAFFSLFVNFFNQPLLSLIWVPLIGLAFDLVLIQKKTMALILDPFWVTQNPQSDLASRIEMLTSCASMAIGKGNLALAERAVRNMQEELVNGLQNEAPEKHGFFVAYWIQRLTYLSEISRQRQMSPLDRQILSSLGRTAISTAKIDPLLATLSLNELARTSQESVEWALDDLVIHSNCVFVQTASSLLKEAKNRDLTEPLTAIIIHLEQLAKTCFQQDKEIDIGSLITPFEDLRLLFEHSTNNERRDVITAGHELLRVLDDFSSLEEVMSQMPDQKEKE